MPKKHTKPLGQPILQYIHRNNYDEQRLYELIWKRAAASQMADAKLEKTTATISISTTSEKFVAQGEVIVFDGFLKVYMESTDNDQEEEAKDMLPPLKIGQTLNLNHILFKRIIYTSASKVH